MGVRFGRNEPMTAPSMAWGYWALLEAAYNDGGAASDEAIAAGAEVACWNRGCLAYAQAVLAGRSGDVSRADELAERGRQYYLGCAPWWNHIWHRLVAVAALRDGWGEPVPWLRQAAADLDDSGFALVASACRGILRKAGERVPRQRGSASMPASCASWASRPVSLTCSSSSGMAAQCRDRRSPVHLTEDGRVPRHQHHHE